MRKLLVTYDVADPKRLGRVRRLMLGYGDPLQLSVFLCELSAVDEIAMKDRLRQTINHNEDRVAVVVVSGKIESIGLSSAPTDDRVVIA